MKKNIKLGKDKIIKVFDIADGDECPYNYCCSCCRYYDSGDYRCYYETWFT